ncbi:hypothetical protein DL768_008172 [Monosporascus sp. mg162]|nr:hypothetical protein DL768_008172 [Monosporascus sp. mg162]
MPRPSDIADLGEVVEKDGQIKYKCQIKKPDGTECGALVQNNKHSIGSHRKVHNPNSKYAADKTSWPQAIKCRETVHNDDGTTEACDFSMKNKHLMLAHYRRDHGLKGRGEATKLYKKYGV